MAAPFDLTRLELTGKLVPVVEGVTQSGSGFTGAAHFSISDLGSLVYLPGITGKEANTLLWVDREGKDESLAADRVHTSVRFSPDGTRAALAVFSEPESDVWIYDLGRKTLTRLTFSGDNNHPLWTPDGLRVVFSSTRDGSQYNLFWKAADGTGQVERLTTSPYSHIPNSFSPDGKRLVFTQIGAGSGGDLHVLSIEGEPSAQLLLQTQDHESDAEISPDGRWIAYQSIESGQSQVYVRPFPNVEEGKWQISSDGGEDPVWGPKGRELFYRNGEAMMVVAINADLLFTGLHPRTLFAGRYITGAFVRDFDLSPDGQRFLMLRASVQQNEPSERTELIIVQNWFEELKRLVPTDN